MDETEETSRRLRKLGKEADRLIRETEKELKRYPVPDERQRREQRNRDRRIQYRRKVLEKKKDQLSREWEQLQLQQKSAQPNDPPARMKELEAEWDVLEAELAKLRDEENRPWRESQEKEAGRALRAVIVASLISGAGAGAILAVVLNLVGVDRLIVVLAGLGASLFFALASFGIAVENRD